MREPETMNVLNRVFISIIIISTLFSQDQQFKLKDGTIVVGTVQEETDTTYTIETKYGSITVNKNEMVQVEYEIKLNSGETFRGTKLSETNEIIQLKTKLGTLNIVKSDILDIKESGQVTQAGEKKESSTTKYRRPYSLADLLFGTGTGAGSTGKDIEFAMGEERLIDTFFDPTAYVLDDGTLYLSGLSFGFGLSDKLMVTSRWWDFSWGDFNIRPKYMLFQKGNWEKESALAIGGHFHTFWQPNKVVWQADTVTVCIDSYNSGNCSTYEERNYGGYFPIGATIKASNDYYNEEDLLEVNETEDLDFMVELFSAYTFSKSRKGMRGRISNTVGALVQIPLNHETYPYRIYWGLDVDITPQLKMIGEAFYDPFFLDLNQRSGSSGPPFGDNWTYKTTAGPVTEDDFKSIRPVHFDFGFIYAVNEHFRFGIHTQPYIIAFYWKF